MTCPSPAAHARIAADLDIHQAAGRARVTPAYLLACERRQRFTLVLAQRLAGIYRCRLDVFLPIARGNVVSGTHKRGAATARPINTRQGCTEKAGRHTGRSEQAGGRGVATQGAGNPHPGERRDRKR